MAPLTGIYFVKVGSPGGGNGSYALLLNDEGDTFTQESAEPNDDPATAEPLTPGLLRGTGKDTSWDFDHYSIEIVEPSIVRVEVVRLRNGRWQSEAAPMLAQAFLVDAAMDPLASPSLAYSGDAGFEVLVEDPGTYYLQVISTINVPAPTGGAYWVRYELLPVGPGMEQEPNDFFVEANPITYGEILSGELDGLDDDVEEHLSFEGSAGDLVRIHIYGPETHLGSTGVMDAVVLDAAGDEYSVSGETGGYEGMPPSHRILRALLRQSGAYYIHLTDVSGSGPIKWSVELELVRSSRWESEPNGHPNTSGPLTSDGRVAGVVEGVSTKDAFAFRVDAPGLITLDLFASSNLVFSMPYHDGHGSTLIPALSVQERVVGGFDTLASSFTTADGCGIAHSTASPLPSLGLSFIATAGTHYAIVGTQEGAVDGDAHYLLEID